MCVFVGMWVHCPVDEFVREDATAVKIFAPFHLPALG